MSGSGGTLPASKATKEKRGTLLRCKAGKQCCEQTANLTSTSGQENTADRTVRGAGDMTKSTWRIVSGGDPCVR